ncbi:hypothetical protein HD806DRAFT_485550 [Xylariaceae sp. AK1471]|nr:hypothetical protein HD806DRAFT_485550 [Xylariaceae sp. AK1471]
MNPQPPDQQPSLQDIFGWARSWGEVRYRFMNHALKDDPYEWQNFTLGLALNKGNAANGLVHNSNVLEDCRLVELSRVGGYGFSNADRQLFQRLYLLAPAEGQQLIQYTGQATGLRAGLPEVFRFCVKLIDAYMNWRVQVLMSARQQILRDPSVRNAATDRVRTNAMTPLHNANKNRLQAVDNAYGVDFLSALRTLLNEAATLDAFNKSSYDALDIARISVTRELRACLLNTNNAALRNQVNNFPGANVQLRAPTGTSIIPLRRRRLNR